uniref:ceramide glucosyltransferase n=1 Tax=Palpitomonas bilix TaxID=652834 RepID=A0A7S3D9D8_9EUKA|mmetsp:Transcript_27030/g.69528  ORF Transcript_27030/g.69528 Transcript_27030/m.69528 type:complete len:425 (+) Transcript_27030:176-1450(+)
MRVCAVLDVNDGVVAWWRYVHMCTSNLRFKHHFTTLPSPCMHDCVGICVSSREGDGSWQEDDVGNVGPSPPLVTIIKPLKGVDDGMEENIVSFLQQDYPEYEIIFCVDAEKDKAYAFVCDILSRHHTYAKRVVFTTKGARVGPNPKINNMVPAFDLVRSELVLSSDSNARVEASYLRRVVKYMTNDDKVVIASGFVAGFSPSGFGGMLECLYLNTFYARFMLLLDALGIPQVVGKNIMFRRDFILRNGGLAALGYHLAEDNVMGQWAVRERLKVVLTREPSYQHIGSHSLYDFWQRHLRWGRLRKGLAFGGFVAEVVTYPFVSLLIGCASIPAVFGMSLSCYCVLHICLHCASDMVLYNCVLGEHDGGGFWKSVCAWAMREITALPMWLHVASGNTVNWRGSVLRVLRGGDIEDVTESATRKLM